MTRKFYRRLAFETLKAFDRLGDEELFNETIRELDHEAMGFNQSLAVGEGTIGREKASALSHFNSAISKDSIGVQQSTDFVAGLGTPGSAIAGSLATPDQNKNVKAFHATAQVNNMSQKIFESK